MKLQIASDFHLNKNKSRYDNIDKYLCFDKNSLPDVLILAGDIDYVDIRNTNFYEYILYILSVIGCDIIYVLGNHEFYCTGHNDLLIDYDDTLEYANKFEENVNSYEYKGKLYILGTHNKISKIINDVVFIGDTLWTDMNKNDLVTKEYCKKSLNDFSYIHYKNRLLLPDDIISINNDVLSVIDETLKKYEYSNYKKVVITHHAINEKSIATKYKNSYLMNGGFVTDIQPIFDKYNYDLHVHGHTHASFDYYIGDTRVICNPHGYMINNNPENEVYNNNLIIEI